MFNVHNVYCMMHLLIYILGGLWRSRLIDHNLVGVFIPFLPLERSHVKKCVEDDLRRKGHGHRISALQNVVDQVVEKMVFFPDDVKLYSSTGCKRVSQRVDILLQESFYVHNEL